MLPLTGIEGMPHDGITKNQQTAPLLHFVCPFAASGVA
jgi:hypothetical protein